MLNKTNKKSIGRKSNLIILTLVICLVAGCFAPMTTYADTKSSPAGSGITAVGFERHGGEFTEGDFFKVMMTGLSIGPLPKVVKKGHDFDGWYDEETPDPGDSPITPSTVVDKDGYYLYHAQWTKSIFTITFNPNGGTAPSEPVRNRAYESTLGDISEVTTSRVGYAFKGWFSAPSGGTAIDKDYIITGNTNIYAQWTPNKYNVFYNTQGGSVSGGGKAVNYQQAYGALPTPSRANFNFTGWFTSPTGGSKITATTTYTTLGNSTIYARWVAKPVYYKVTFNGNKGKIKKKKTKAITKLKDTKVGKLPKATRKGYKFKGWYTKKKGGKKIKASTKVTKNIKYYAQWKKKKK